AFELFFEELDGRGGIAELEVLLAYLARDGRARGARLGGELVAVEGAGDVAARLEELGRAQEMLGARLGVRRLLGELFERLERALGVAHLRAQRRERAQRLRMARRELERPLVRRQGARGVSEILGEHATEPNAEIDLDRVVGCGGELPFEELNEILVALLSAVVARELLRGGRARGIERQHRLELGRGPLVIEELLRVNLGEPLAQADLLARGDGEVELPPEHLDELAVAPRAREDAIERSE